MNLTWIKPFLIDGHKVFMTPIERDIFAVIYNKHGLIAEFDEIIDLVWGTVRNPPLDIRTCIAVNISRLRVSLKRTRFRIVNVRGRGFYMERIAA